MKRYSDRLRQLAAVVAVLGLSQAIPRQARADFAYAYAEQTISGLTITPTGAVTPVGTFSSQAQDSTTFNGVGNSNSDPANPLQAYQGGLPQAPENSFMRYAPGTPPASPTTPPSFTRGDVLFTNGGGTNSSAVVAESFINTGPGSPTSETGNAGIAASLNFTLSTATALTINYNYSNDLFVFTSASGTAKANYLFNIVIKDNTGAVVFNSTTDNTNLSLASPPNGAEVIRSGTESVVTPTLNTGIEYTIVFTEQTQTSVTAVPEPGSLSLALLAIGGLIPIGYRMKRRRLD
jgi:hypothetical protein